MQQLTCTDQNAAIKMYIYERSNNRKTACTSKMEKQHKNQMEKQHKNRMHQLEKGVDT